MVTNDALTDYCIHLNAAGCGGDAFLQDWNSFDQLRGLDGIGGGVTTEAASLGMERRIGMGLR
jgi:hypothetical protein